MEGQGREGDGLGSKRDWDGGLGRGTGTGEGGMKSGTRRTGRIDSGAYCPISFFLRCVNIER
jgi:hypothetical protein